MFDESVTWYLPLPPTLEDSNPSSEDEVREAEIPPNERETETLEESPVSFRLSGLNEQLSRFDQSNEEPKSNGDSVVHSPCRKSRRRLTCKEKGKEKMSGYGANRDKSDRRESDSEKRNEGPSRVKSVSAKKAEQHRLLNNYADLPARRTLLCGSYTMSTWRITMRT